MIASNTMEGFVFLFLIVRLQSFFNFILWSPNPVLVTVISVLQVSIEILIIVIFNFKGIFWCKKYQRRA